MGTSKQACLKSLKCQADCSTSAALATGTTDEEEGGDISWGLTIVGHSVVGIGVRVSMLGCGRRLCCAK